MLYAVIFNFSAQDGERSGSLSRAVSEKCVKIFSTLFRKDFSQAVTEGWADYFEYPIRKLAHFSEYACMGILVFLLWSQWLVHRGKRYLPTAIWVAASAAADEIHQLFVPGRYGCIADVCLDIGGGVFGMAVCVFLGKILVCLRKKGKGFPGCRPN